MKTIAPSIDIDYLFIHHRYNLKFTQTNNYWVMKYILQP